MQSWLKRWGEGLLAALCILSIVFAAIWTRGEDLRKLAAQGAAAGGDETLRDVQTPAPWARPLEGGAFSAYKGAVKSDGLWTFDPWVKSPAARGQPVYAPAPGIVETADNGRVVLRLAKDVTLCFSGLGALSVSPGDQAAAGQRLGLVGADAGLALSAQRGGEYFDPLSLFDH